MNKTIVIAGIVILVLIGGGLFVANQQSKSSEDAKMTQEKTAMMKKDEGDKMMGDKMSDAHYVVYSKTAFDDAAGTRRVLFFYANWCPICKPADADFTANVSKLPSDVTLIRVNYNDTDTDQEEKDLAKQYGITYQHTFVQIDAQGKEVAKWNGGQTDELLANIK